MPENRASDQVQDTASQLLLARASRLRERPKEEDQKVFWTAEFPLGGEPYALPLETLVACQPLRLVTPVPLSDPHLTGIVRFQRRLLSVMSLSGMLGSPGWKRDPSVLLVLMLEGDRLVAVDCEEIPRSSSVSFEDLRKTQSEGELDRVLVVPRPNQGPLKLINPSLLFSNFHTGSGHGK